MTRLQIPPTLERFTIPRSVMTATAEFLQDRGKAGVEGTVLWLGEVISDIEAKITEPYVPEQVAYRTPHGLAVEVTRRGLNDLIRWLANGVFVLARVHSHGEEAYHSETDDQNMIISHEGAISIVVPNFAAHGLDLADCSVNLLRPGQGWIELSADEVRLRLQVLG
jgi:hypothetical protein